MKFKIQKKLIESVMSDVSLLVSSSNMISTPVFKAVLFEVFNNEIIITASNTTTSINTKIKAEESKLVVESTGSFLTPIKKLQELIRKTDASALIFEKTEKSILTITTKKSRYSLQLYNVETYPKINFEIIGHVFDINKKTIEEISNTIIFSADKEHRQARKEFAGINLISANNKLNVFATNTHRLSKLTTDSSQKETNIILPTIFFKLFNKTNTTKGKDQQIWISEEKTQIKTDLTTIQFQNINGKYPDVSKAIPIESTTQLIVNKREIEKALDRIEMFTNEENKIKLTLSEEKLFISSTNQTTGISIEKIDDFNKQGEDVEILISSKYLLEAIQATNNKEIKIDFNTNQKPIIIKNPNKENTIHIVSPYRWEN